MSLERVPQSFHQRVEKQNASDVNTASLAVQQSLQEIFDDFTVFVSNQLRSQHADDYD